MVIVRRLFLRFYTLVGYIILRRFEVYKGNMLTFAQKAGIDIEGLHKFIEGRRR